jgi:UDP-N-acetylmuramoylalanine--D-glutamate ligase
MKLGFAKGKHYGVVGLGKSGKAVVAALRDSGATVATWDDKNAGPDETNPESWDWKSLTAVVMSPGIAWYHPTMHPVATLAKTHEVPFIGDIELLYRAQPHALYVGITGTNGKSTTTALIGHILKENNVKHAVGGNIGTPVMELPAMGEDGTYVLELSSYQLDLLVTTRMQVAVLLNLSADHIDHHGTMERYIAAKKHIFDRQKKKDVAIVGIDDPLSDDLCKQMRAARQQCVIPISAKTKLASGIHVHKGILTNSFALMEQSADIRAIKSLQGEHNWQNAAAAYGACFAIGVSHEGIIAAMHSYPGLRHRMQWLGEIAGVQFVNDSKATNADAAQKALKTYDNIYWIAGGIAKEGGIAALAPYFKKIKHAYLIGEAADDFSATLAGQVPTTLSGTLAAAFVQAARDAPKGSAIVLAPACASFDQYPNFEARGDAFIALVEAWKKKGAAA